MRRTIPLQVPGVTEATVDADARVVEVREVHSVNSLLDEEPPHGYVLVIEEPEPRTRVERRRFHVGGQWHQSWPAVAVVPWAGSSLGVYEQRLPDVPTAVEDGEARP